MFVLLSIKPEYVEEIFNGNKKYEFRKNRIARKEANQALIYSTSPVKRIVGKFDIGKIVERHPELLWEEYQLVSGVDNEAFFSYFDGKSKGFAIEITQVEKFRQPIDPRIILPSFTPPQSFYYLDQDILNSYY